MVVGKDNGSTHPVKVSEPHFPVREEFRGSSYLDRYRILCERLVLEHKYSAVALIATSGANDYENVSDCITIESFIASFYGHLLGVQDEFFK